MTYTVRQSNARKWPVHVKCLVGNDAGDVAEITRTFVAHFAPLSEKQYKAIHADADLRFPLGTPKKAIPTPVDDVRTLGEPFEACSADADGHASDGRPDTDYLLARNAYIFGRVMIGWGPEVCDEDGQPIAFSVQALEEMVTGPDGLAVSAALNEALLQIRFGIAPQKNLSTSPASGGERGESAPIPSPAT
jgi:hypothetical protein